MLVETQAIVLRTQRFGDTSIVATLYTQQFGKCAVLAKGARTPGSAQGVALEVPNHIRVAFYRKPRREVFLVRFAETVERFHQIRTSMERMATALFVVESILLTQELEEPNPVLYALLLQALRGTEQSSSFSVSIAIAFLLRLARLLGFAIPIDRDTAWNSQQTYVLHPQDGAFKIATRHDNGGIFFSGSEIALLSTLSHLPLEAASSVEVPPSSSLSLLRRLIAYLEHHLERRLVFRSLELWTVGSEI